MIEQDQIAGIIIAGGKATRMGGGEKTLLEIAGKPIAAMIINRLKPQVRSVAINSNAEAARFANLEVPVFADNPSVFEGPLAGILSAMNWTLEHQPTATHIATVAGDSPFFPGDLVACLGKNAPNANTIVMAKSDGFNHPVFALWPLVMRDSLDTWLNTTGVLRVMAWVKTQPHTMVDFSTSDAPDPFFNINTPEDLAVAETMALELAR